MSRAVAFCTDCRQASEQTVCDATEQSVTVVEKTCNEALHECLCGIDRQGSCNQA